MLISTSTRTPAPRGFTLIEVMAVLLLLGTLLALAVPGLRDLIAKHAASGAAQSFAEALDIARMEAVKRNAAVAVCRTAKGSSACLQPASGWATGWTVFVDRGTPGQLDAADQLIRVYAPDGGGLLSTESQASSAALVFRPLAPVDGLQGPSLRVAFAHVGKPDAAWTVCLSSLGLVQLVEGESQCN